MGFHLPDTLEQACPTCSPGATCAPGRLWMQPPRSLLQNSPLSGGGEGEPQGPSRILPSHGSPLNGCAHFKKLCAQIKLWRSCTCGSGTPYPLSPQPGWAFGEWLPLFWPPLQPSLPLPGRARLCSGQTQRPEVGLTQASLVSPLAAG